MNLVKQKFSLAERVGTRAGQTCSNKNAVLESDVLVKVMSKRYLRFLCIPYSV